jgi:hypothetical protein
VRVAQRRYDQATESLRLTYEAVQNHRLLPERHRPTPERYRAGTD